MGRVMMNIGNGIDRRALCLGFAALATLATAAPARAGNAWDEIRGSLYGSTRIEDGHGIVALSAPVRPADMRSVPIAADVSFKDGRSVRSVSFIIDENPTPVVAVFHVAGDRPSIAVKSNFRVDRQSDIRAIVEASDGKLYMVAQLIKFAGGQSSCSAPPQGDPAEIKASMGRMKMIEVQAQAEPGSIAKTSALGRARINLRHPNHTGMVMDQITLLYTPMKMVSEIDVAQDGKSILRVEGSIALAQDPMIEFDYPRGGAQDFAVTMKDTDGGAWTKAFHLGPAT